MKKEMLEYYCASIKDLFSLTVFLFRKNTNEIDLDQVADNYDVPFHFEKGVMDFYSGSNLFDTSKIVSYYLSDDNIGFGCVSDMRSDYCLYIGPCLLSDLNEKLMNAMMNRYNSPFLNDPDKYYDQLYAYLAKLPRLSQERFMMLLRFTNAYVNGVSLQEEDFHVSSLSKKKFELENRSRSIVDNVPDIERQKQVYNTIVSHIKTANLAKLHQYWAGLKGNNPLFEVDPSSKVDKIRQRKNNFIRFLSYVETQIMSPQISARVLNEISNRYIEQTENIVSVQQLDQLCLEALSELARLVRTYQNAKCSDNLTIKKAIEYIHDHIYENLSCEEIAQALNLSRGRLSNLFHQEMALSLPDYINREKIETARILLESTDSRIIDISHSLSFSSQSYFQNIFKKYTGMTPKQYRDQANKGND